MTKLYPTKQSPPSYVFYTDNDLGRFKIPNALKALGAQVEAHADHFSGAMKDTDWIAQVGHRGWIALTHNKDFVNEEKEAVLTFGLRLFVLTGKRGHDDLVTILQCTYKKMLQYLNTHPAPWIARIHRPTPEQLKHNPAAPGLIRHWYPER